MNMIIVYNNQAHDNAATFHKLDKCTFSCLPCRVINTSQCTWDAREKARNSGQRHLRQCHHTASCCLAKDTTFKWSLCQQRRYVPSCHWLCL